MDMDIRFHVFNKDEHPGIPVPCMGKAGPSPMYQSVMKNWSDQFHRRLKEIEGGDVVKGKSWWSGWI